MSVLFGKEVVLFSPLEGKVTFHGKPAVNAKITRTLKWKDNEGETEIFFADDQGNFSLPLKKRRIWILPLAEFVISQAILVLHAGQEVQIWGRTKRGTDIYAELAGKPVNFRCELTDEITYFDVADGLFGTSCRWDGNESNDEQQ